MDHFVDERDYKPKIAIASWTPRGKSGVNKTLVTDGAAGSVRERGCRSRQAA